MKKVQILLPLLSLFVVMSASSQSNLQPDSPQYEKLKSEGKLKPTMVRRGDKIVFAPPANVYRRQMPGPNESQAQHVQCNCLIPLDSTFSIAPFTNGTPPEYRNDDGSTASINLPFTFNFYGQAVNHVFINNNGNISFDMGYFQYVTNPFPSTQFLMVAPFWADVDTRDPGSGLVYYKITPTYMVVKWDNVGYFGNHVDKLNSFQLIITDGIDPLLPPGNNVDFCYGDMQWTTGDASLSCAPGGNGFGGCPATVGANAANGTDYIQFGQFDEPGYGYDGPFGANDSVDFLDNQNFILNTNTTGGSTYIPPIIHGLVVCDTITLCSTDTAFRDTIPISIDFLSPEQNQITTITTSFSEMEFFI